MRFQNYKKAERAIRGPSGDVSVPRPKPFILSDPSGNEISRHVSLCSAIAASAKTAHGWKCLVREEVPRPDMAKVMAAVDRLEKLQRAKRFEPETLQMVARISEKRKWNPFTGSAPALPWGPATTLDDSNLHK